MAWFRMMGVDAVEYHRATVLGRANDHAGRALAYYGSRGETPLEWGGKVAARLGLHGGVEDAEYEAIFGRGGAAHPVLGVRLVETAHPGVELVVAPDKSVSLLGVLGRADDMHAIVDAETAGTLAYLERWFERQGGRRGRAQTRTHTGGLLWARTRHATTRAGDPLAHDHVLIANVTEMQDLLGGWKALDTAALRDVNHAATMAGRLAASAEAVSRGYAIEPAAGPSGKLDSWRIAGIPERACVLLSKRSDQITLELESAGFDSYRARNIAARQDRDAKAGEGADDLLPRWRAELAEAGLPVDRLLARLDLVNERATPRSASAPADMSQIADDVLKGPLARYKAFDYHDVARRVAPLLYGHDVAVLDKAVRAVIEHHDTVPLVGAPAARGRTYVAASVLDAELRVADTAERLSRAVSPSVRLAALAAAIDGKTWALGRTLTDSQRRAVVSIASGGRGLDVIVGAAGAGKTTALDVLRSAYEADGLRVIGTATSGQAARAMAREASIESHTIASLLHRLRAGSIALDHRTVVLVDEAGMTDDRALLAVLLAAERAHTKVVIIGDHHQLGAVEPGGGLEGLVHRHPDAVHVLEENVRQADPTEHHALAALRDGDPGAAVDWFAAHDRIHSGPTRSDVIEEAVGAWLADTLDGKTTVLLAWRRGDVTALNKAARSAWRDAGRLGDAELTVDDRRYAVGDRVVALQPLHDEMRTSQRATVTALSANGVRVRTDDGIHLNLHIESMSKVHLDHAYAVTVHRAQGATVDRAHVVADGGGRELAYVAMSRARFGTHVYAIAGSDAEAIAAVRHEWSQSRRERWTSDVDRPADGPGEQRPRLAARHLALEPRALVQRELEGLRGAIQDLRRGTGDYEHQAVGQAYRDLESARARHDEVRAGLADPTTRRRARRQWRREAPVAAAELNAAEQRFEVMVQPLENDLHRRLDDTRQRLRDIDRRDALATAIAPPIVERAVGAAWGFAVEL